MVPACRALATLGVLLMRQMENASPHAPFPTVLVVDDERDLRNVLAVLLEEDGFVVADAANGRDAIVYLRSGLPVHAIVVDLEMPVMDGWTFLAERQRDPVWRATPTFVMTGLDGDALRLDALGDTRVFPKPPNLELLVDALRAVLGS
jgi:CheY-like chemotaxis protein